MELGVNKITRNIKFSNSPLPLFAWAERRHVIPLSLSKHVIARRHRLSPAWARLVCREAGLGGHDDG